MWCNRHLWQDLNKKLVSVTDWNKIDHLSELHGITPQLLHAIKAQKQETLLPPYIVQKWNKEVSRIAAENICKLTVLKEIIVLFNTGNIPVVLLRGARSAWSRYPTPELRPMADLDILVPHKQLLSAVKLLQKEGYLLIKSGEWNFIHPHFSGVVLDLHVDCFPWYGVKDMELLWKKAKPCDFSCANNVFMLPNEETIIAETCHAVLCHGFPKLLWLLDIALLTHEKIDWERLSVIARNLGVTVPVQLFLELAKDMAGAIVGQGPDMTLGERFQKKILVQLLSSFEEFPVTNIGHLLSFIWLRGFRKKSQYLKERFFPGSIFLARRYNAQNHNHHIFWKIIRPLLILWETMLLFGKIAKHYLHKRKNFNN